MKSYKCMSCGKIVTLGDALIQSDDIVCTACGGNVDVFKAYNEDGLTYSRSDIRYFNELFPEDGPERCVEAGCSRKRIRGSIFCAPHKFSVVRNKPCPWEAPQKVPKLFKIF
jgi:DNA-directed RNA polymerase subunit RPC12/RpoP